METTPCDYLGMCLYDYLGSDRCRMCCGLGADDDEPDYYEYEMEEENVFDE